ncbi:hypothetical protein L484_015560 [Morus notabilis]|uniref:Uncharacterized protein n=1 Tax=Morus notabilis TaxID=981085 RepID=W9SL81_9ROSA|nr:hypothetical protein L484_015560 [Morus notabilis]
MAFPFSPFSHFLRIVPEAQARREKPRAPIAVAPIQAPIAVVTTQAPIAVATRAVLPPIESRRTPSFSAFLHSIWLVQSRPRISISLDPVVASPAPLFPARSGQPPFLLLHHSPHLLLCPIGSSLALHHRSLSRPHSHHDPVYRSCSPLVFHSRTFVCVSPHDPVYRSGFFSFDALESDFGSLGVPWIAGISGC